MVPGVKVGQLNDIAALEKLVDDKTCGVIVEPIQGEGGVYETSEEFLTALRERCNKVGAVLIFDEIQVCIDCEMGLIRVVWIIEDRKVVGTQSFFAFCRVGYTYDG